MGGQDSVLRPAYGFTRSTPGATPPARHLLGAVFSLVILLSFLVLFLGLGFSIGISYDPSEIPYTEDLPEPNMDYKDVYTVKYKDDELYKQMFDRIRQMDTKPVNCSNSILYRLNHPRGFGSQWNNLLNAFIYAVYIDRTFAIEDVLWNYGKFAMYFDSPIVSHSAKCYFSNASELSYKVLTMPTEEIPKITWDYGYRFDYWHLFAKENPILMDFNLKRSAALKLWRHPAEIDHLIDLEQEKMYQDYGFNSSFVSGKFVVGLHVRRGDKIAMHEAEALPFDLYSNATHKVVQSRKIDPKNVVAIIACDEDWQGRILKNLLHEDYSTILLPGLGNGFHQDEFGELPIAEKEKQTLTLLTTIRIFRHSNYLICTFSSNMCRLMALLRNDGLNSIASMDVQEWGAF